MLLMWRWWLGKLKVFSGKAVCQIMQAPWFCGSAETWKSCGYAKTDTGEHSYRTSARP